MQIIVLIFASILLPVVTGKLDDTFHNYDLVRDVNIHTLSKREIAERLHTTHLTLTAFGQNFTLELKPSQDLFSADFSVTVVHGDNTKETLLGFDKQNFFTGHVINESRSRATIHIDENNLVTGTFTSHGEEYALEPIFNHLEEEDEGAFHSESTMIAYRRTDIKTDSDRSALCGATHPNVTEEDFDDIHFQQFDRESHARRKRQTTSGKTCKILAVADYKYFSHMGQNNKFYTANYVSNIINQVNQIYRSTSFSTGTGYGFELQGIVVHDGPTTLTTAESYPYNQEKTNWETIDLLRAFGQVTEYDGYCLAHLFTAQSMSSSVLGLAYIASHRPNTAGGICSPTRSLNGVPSIFNIGWSSSRNGVGSTVSFTQQYLVTAHEFGHNLGSEHDPSGSCSPGSILGDGKYLMYAYSVTGEDPNNDEFSSCSRSAMSAVLQNKAAECFQVASEETPCGNGRLDPGEECDEGLLGKLGGGECCTTTCALISGASCSSANYPCCSQCQLAPSTYECQSDIDGLCKNASFCDGINFECPDAPNKPDGAGCIEGGFCSTGVCIPFCEYMLTTNSCICDTVETSCKRCCVLNGQCQVEGSYILPNGRSCIQGYCQQGNCIKVTTALVDRLWEFIDEISVDLIVEAFRTNMVGCVTGFSLVVYIPICIIIWCINIGKLDANTRKIMDRGIMWRSTESTKIKNENLGNTEELEDKKRKRDWKKENSVHVRTDRGLAHDEDRRPISLPGRSTSKPATLDAGDLLDSNSYRRPGSRNQIQPLARRKPTSSHA